MGEYYFGENNIPNTITGMWYLQILGSVCHLNAGLDYKI